MLVRLKLIVPSLLAAGLFPGLVEGQLIEVRRGYVRAPFVRVQRGRRVRAPFVDLGDRQTSPQYGIPQYETPGYGTPQHPTSGYGSSTLQPPPVPPAEPEPTPVAAQAETVLDVTQMDKAELEQTIVAGEAELDRELNQVTAGDQWRRRLHVGRLEELLTAENVAIDSEERSSQLELILQAYHQVLVNPAFRPVTQLDGFRTVQPALRLLLLSPIERQFERLVASSQALETELARLPNGANWANHLRLPADLVQETEATGAEVDALTSLLSRFDTAAGDSRNRPVTGLAAFQATHERLGKYIDLVTEVAATASEPVSVEEPVSVKKPISSDEPVVIRQRRDLAPTPAGNLSR